MNIPKEQINIEMYLVMRNNLINKLRQNKELNK
jgi:hypothetical protein